jgi:hypothetical protein
MRTGEDQMSEGIHDNLRSCLTALALAACNVSGQRKNVIVE